MMTQNLPASFTVGDTLTATVTSKEYPASKGWALQFTITNGESTKTAAATADGDNYAINVPAATTATWSAGAYTFTLAVTNASGERHTIANGPIKLTPNLASGAPFDARSHARKILDAIEAYLENQATNGQMEILETQFDMRRMKREGKAEFIKLRNLYRAEVLAEEQAARAAQGLSTGKTLRVRFQNG